MEIKTRKCLYCGKDFKFEDHEQYCSTECEDNYYLYKYGIKKKKKEKYIENHLSEIAMKAKEAGMTYGQYVGQQYAKTLKIERRWI